MVYLTKEQRRAVWRVYNRHPSNISYRQFRRTVQPGPDCVMVRWSGMWLGIEYDGYTHS